MWIDGQVEPLREDVLRVLRLNLGEIPSDLMHAVEHQEDFDTLLHWFNYARLSDSADTFRGLTSRYCHEIMRGPFRRVLLRGWELIGSGHKPLRREQSASESVPRNHPRDQSGDETCHPVAESPPA
jgi:hypothetical protein